MNAGENILANLVRIGTVSSVDEAKRTARVIFEDKGLVSGSLHVLQQPNTALSIEVNGNHSHAVIGGGNTEINGQHTHAGITAHWMPRVNDTVLVLYLPVFNGDGFIIGVI